MYAFSMELLLLMFVLGFAQLIWAFIHMATTANDTTQKHYAIYFAGVVIYFIVLFVLLQLENNFYGFEFWRKVHFVGTAFALALYHFGILCANVRLGNGPSIPANGSEDI
jgi:hypothetical protein